LGGGSERVGETLRALEQLGAAMRAAHAEAKSLRIASHPLPSSSGFRPLSKPSPPLDSGKWTDQLHRLSGAFSSEVAMRASAMQLRHLHRDVSNALELALVALAPNSMIEALAAAAGLLNALQELPLESDSLQVWAKEAASRAERTLSEWRSWERR